MMRPAIHDFLLHLVYVSIFSSCSGPRVCRYHSSRAEVSMARLSLCCGMFRYLTPDRSLFQHKPICEEWHWFSLFCYLFVRLFIYQYKFATLMFSFRINGAIFVTWIAWMAVNVKGLRREPNGSFIVVRIINVTLVRRTAGITVNV